MEEENYKSVRVRVRVFGDVRLSAHIQMMVFELDSEGSFDCHSSKKGKSFSLKILKTDIKPIHLSFCISVYYKTGASEI